MQETKPTPDTIVKPEANGLPSTLALAYAGLGEKEKALQQASSGRERLRNRRREQAGSRKFCKRKSRPSSARPTTPSRPYRIFCKFPPALLSRT